ncbi:MAG: hypothetical protein REI93_11705 [Pedobacter sp.]|nr:hypothetical protein [Pedobacter sp.]
MAQLSANAQSILARRLSMNIERQPLRKVLSLIEEKGRFRFSYNSNVVPIDSLVTVRESDIDLATMLDRLFNQQFEYHESGNFLIIRYAPNELLMLVNESIGTPELYTITGQIVDKNTEKPISAASIYEKNLLVSEISDRNGYFTMRLKDVSQPISLTVSKENYKSTVTNFLAEVNVTNRPKRPVESFISGNLSEIERSWLGRTFVTTTQKIQSLNIGGLISNAPFQFALVPGLNSHGSLSGQVVNKFSLNAVGAYSAGVDGAEIGLVFNISKSNVRYFQFAGAFNLVGGEVHGVQIAGFLNNVYGKVNAAQVAVGGNYVRQNFEGFQVGGVFNWVKADFRGAQFSVGLNSVTGKLDGSQVGALNLTKGQTRGLQIGVAGNMVGGKSTGLQIGGIANINKEADALNIAVGANLTLHTSRGMQIGLINYANKQKGVQLGLLNLANENDGYSIGLLNFSLKGYHKFEFGTNESTELNAIYKGGNKLLYSMLLFGTNTSASPKIYTAGWGLGKEISLFKPLGINPEASLQYVYQGSFDYLNLLYKFQLPVHVRFNKWLAVQGGPSINIYRTRQQSKFDNYGLLQEKHRDFSFGHPDYTGWYGWSVGIVLL